MRVNWLNVIGLVLALVLIASTHWIISPDVVPAGTDTIGEIGRSHQVSGWQKGAREPWGNYVLMAEVGALVVIGLAYIILKEE